MTGQYQYVIVYLNGSKYLLLKKGGVRMRKYWVTLEDNDFKALEQIATEKGTSVGTLSKEIIRSYLGRHNDETDEINVEVLIESMKEKMLSMTSESAPFIVKDLIEDSWDLLTRSEKMICSKSLARMVADSDEFEISEKKNGLNYYKHI